MISEKELQKIDQQLHKLILEGFADNPEAQRVYEKAECERKEEKENYQKNKGHKKMRD